jgi:hypothetical protein
VRTVLMGRERFMHHLNRKRRTRRATYGSGGRELYELANGASLPEADTTLLVHQHGRRRGRSVSLRVHALDGDRVNATFAFATALGAKLDGEIAGDLDVIWEISVANAIIRLIARNRNDFADWNCSASVGSRNAHRHQAQRVIGWSEHVRTGRDACEDDRRHVVLDLECADLAPVAA